MLMARLATKRAKPNGQHRITTDTALSALDTLDASDLPGVGWQASKVLTSHGVSTVGELREVPRAMLLSWFSASVADSLWRLCRGIDDRQLDYEVDRLQKSIGVEVWQLPPHTCAHTRTHTHVHSQAHTRTNTHTNTHTHSWRWWGDVDCMNSTVFSASLRHAYCQLCALFDVVAR